MFRSHLIGIFLISTLVACQAVRDLAKVKYVEISDQQSVMYIRNSPKIKSIEVRNDSDDIIRLEKINMFPGFIAYRKVRYGRLYGSTSALRDTFYNMKSLNSAKKKIWFFSIKKQNKTNYY